MIRPATRLALWLGGLHALVDATTVTAAYRAGLPLPPEAAFALVLGYDLIAFAGQPLLGLGIDRLRAARVALVAGLVLAAAAVPALAAGAWTAVALAGVGNALFHLGAGTLVLDAAPCRSAPAGLFVAPGALGLGFGRWYGPAAGPAWPLALVLLAALLLATRLRPPPPEDVPPPAPVGGAARLAAVLLLLLSVAVRSWAGAGVPAGLPRDTGFLVALSLAAAFGKGLGGLTADRLGWKAVAVGALLVATPLAAFGGSNAAIVVPAVILVQATMPVTLVACVLALPGRTATAFGLPCLALVLGALPTFFPWGRSGPLPFLLVLPASAAALAGGLALLGPRIPVPRSAAR